MSFGNIVDQILKDGFGERKAARDRVGRSEQNLQNQPGIDRLLQEVQNAFGGQGGGRSGGQGLQERARDFLRTEQAKGLTGGQIGGIGAAAGLLFGGGLGGAARGGALAVLGTLAYSAYRRAQGGAEPPADEIRKLSAPETERLLVKAMIAAAKADGKVSQTELERILGQLGGEEVTADEKAFVFDQLSRPADIASIAAEVSGQAQAAEVYAASLMAVDGDSEAERRHLRELARALNLDDETVAYLHEQTGAPV